MQILQKSFLFIVFFLLVTSLQSMAQQPHFIYIQSDDKEPFYVVFKEKVYSSSETGYLIIPKLISGDYKFTLGFPLNKFPEQQFNYTLNNTDAGYSLKQFGDKGWGLVDLQTQSILMAGAETAIAVNTNSAFSNMLSEVADDSALSKKNIVVPEEKKTADNDTNAAAINKAVTENVNTTDAIEPVAHSNASNIAAPVKTFEQSTSEGTSLTFVDKDEKGTDTIRLVIPVATQNKKNRNKKVNNTEAITDVTKAENVNSGDVNTNIVAKTDTSTNKKEISNPFFNENKKSENNTSANEAAINDTNSEVSTSTATSLNLYRNGCNAMLSDADFGKMKRKMFSQNSNEKMIGVATKYISGKCLNTEQVKNLGVLFITDEGRYNLFDAMFKYVYDYGNYNSLASQIIDSNYKKRFLALLQ